MNTQRTGQPTAAQLNARSHRHGDGTFKAFDHHQSSQTLGGAQDSRHWGSSGAEVGTSSPWGLISHIDRIGEGLDFAFTDSHEGIKASQERNAVIPAALRNRSGWYNGDDDRNVIMFVFPEEYSCGTGNTAEQIFESAKQSLKDRRPRDYMRATGETLGPEDSEVLALDAWKKMHQNAPMAAGGRSTAAHPDFVAVTTAEGEFLVPRDEFGPGHSGRRPGPHGYNVPFPIDTARHPRIADEKDFMPAPEPPAVVKADVLGALDTLELTAAEKESARKELSKLYRFKEYGIASYADIIRDHGVLGVEEYMASTGKSRTYRLAAKNGGGYKISAKAHKALAQALPDLSTPAEKAGIDASLAYSKWAAADHDVRSRGVWADFKDRRKVEALKEASDAAAARRDELQREERESAAYQAEKAAGIAEREARDRARLEAEKAALEQFNQWAGAATAP